MKNTQDLVAKILTSIVFAHYSESQRPGTFQETMDSMLLANNLPKVNFPQQIVTKVFSNLLRQSKDTIIEGFNTPTENNVVEEIITVSENIVEHNIRTTNVMETEQTDHGFKRALVSSPEAPKKKREMATTSMATLQCKRSAQLQLPNPPTSLSLTLSPNAFPAQGEQLKTHVQDPHHVIKATTRKKHLTLVLYPKHSKLAEASSLKLYRVSVFKINN